MRRKLLNVLMLTAVFSLSSALNVSLAFAAENTGGGALKALGESDADTNDMFTMENDQTEAQKAYAELMSAYPDMSCKEYYGGAYIGDDNVLVVNVTTQSDDVKKEIQEITKAQNVKFKEVTYSYKQLMDLYETISDKMKNSNWKEKINCCYVDETNNRVVVEVLDDKTISDFNQEILCNEAVTFHVVKEAINDDVMVKPEAGLNADGNEAFKKDGIDYKVAKKTNKNMAVVVCGCDPDKKIVKIPGSVTFKGKTYKVTAIVKNTFKNQPKLRKVVAGRNVNRIENSAFVKCKRLSLIIIKNKECKYSEKIVKKSGECKIKVAS